MAILTFEASLKEIKKEKKIGIHLCKSTMKTLEGAVRHIVSTVTEIIPT